MSVILIFSPFLFLMKYIFSEKRFSTRNLKHNRRNFFIAVNVIYAVLVEVPLFLYFVCLITTLVFLIIIIRRKIILNDKASKNIYKYSKILDLYVIDHNRLR